MSQAGGVRCIQYTNSECKFPHQFYSSGKTWRPSIRGRERPATCVEASTNGGAEPGVWDSLNYHEPEYDTVMVIFRGSNKFLRYCSSLFASLSSLSSDVHMFLQSYLVNIHISLDFYTPIVTFLVQNSLHSMKTLIPITPFRISHIFSAPITTAVTK